MTTAPLLSFDLDRTCPAAPERVWAAFTRAERLELTVEGLSGEQAAEGMRTGWQWCLEGIAAQLDGAA